MISFFDAEGCRWPNGYFTSNNYYGQLGRNFAEEFANEFMTIYGAVSCSDVLHLKLTELKVFFGEDKHLYILSYFRLLQSNGNQTNQPNNPPLEEIDSAAIIISLLRIIEFYEDKIIAASILNK